MAKKAARRSPKKKAAATKPTRRTAATGEPAARRRATPRTRSWGTSTDARKRGVRSKAKSTISDEAYEEMQKGWPESGKKKWIAATVISGASPPLMSCRESIEQPARERAQSGRFSAKQLVLRLLVVGTAEDLQEFFDERKSPARLCRSRAGRGSSGGRTSGSRRSSARRRAASDSPCCRSRGAVLTQPCGHSLPVFRRELIGDVVGVGQSGEERCVVLRGVAQHQGGRRAAGRRSSCRSRRAARSSWRSFGLGRGRSRGGTP